MAGSSPRSGPDQAGKKHIALPFGHFWIKGPNGSHLCLILPAIGPRVSAIWRSLPDPVKPLETFLCKSEAVYNFFIRTEVAMVSLISHNSLAKICELNYSLDFRPSNILLRVSDLDSLNGEQLVTEFGEPRTISPKNIVQPINWRNSTLDILQTRPASLTLASLVRPRAWESHQASPHLSSS